MCGYKPAVHYTQDFSACVYPTAKMQILISVPLYNECALLICYGMGVFFLLLSDIQTRVSTFS